MLYPQNGVRIMTIDSVTSLHPKSDSIGWTCLWACPQAYLRNHTSNIRQMFYVSGRSSALLNWQRSDRPAIRFSIRNLGFTMPHFLRSDLISLQILLLPRSWTSLYPTIPRLQNILNNCHCHCSFQARLLQLYHNLPESRSDHGTNGSITLLHVLLS